VPLHRTLVLDNVTARFTAAHPDAQVLSAGLGLCTRHARLADRVPATVSWIGIDTPDVIDLRRRLLPDDPVTLVAADLSEPGWAATLDADRPTVVLAEGVLMYLDPPGLAAFLTETRDHLGPGTEVLGDYFHPTVAASDRHPIVRATGARFLSGARNGAALAATVSGYRCLADLPVMERVSIAQRAVANAFRFVTRGSRLYAVSHLVVTDRALPATTPPAPAPGSG
jgi:O-methyltransferase